MGLVGLADVHLVNVDPWISVGLMAVNLQLKWMWIHGSQWSSVVVLSVDFGSGSSLMDQTDIDLGAICGMSIMSVRPTLAHFGRIDGGHIDGGQIQKGHDSQIHEARSMSPWSTYAKSMKPDP